MDIKIKYKMSINKQASKNTFQVNIQIINIFTPKHQKLRTKEKGEKYTYDTSKSTIHTKCR